MKKYFLLLLFISPLISHAHLAESVTCTINNIPDGKVDKYVLLRLEANSALLSWKKNQRSETQEFILAKDLDCMPSKSDFRVVNCLRAAPEGSRRVSDASLTIIKHSYLSAVSVHNQTGEPRDALSENYRLYFRDDRPPTKEIDKNFMLPQCRASEGWELEWAKSLLNRNPSN